MGLRWWNLGAMAVWTGALLVSTGCTYNLKYLPATEEEKPVRAEKPIETRVGVAVFENDTTGEYGQGDTVIDPIGTLSESICEALRERGIFKSVRYLAVPVRETDDLAEIGRKYGVDAVLTGRVSAFYISGGPNPLALTLLSPVSAVAIFGPPTALGWNRFDGVVYCQLLPCGPGPILWTSPKCEIGHEEDVWVSPYVGKEVTGDVYSRGLSKLCRVVASRLAEDVSGRRDVYVAALTGRGRPVAESPPVYVRAKKALAVPGASKHMAVVVGVSEYSLSGADGLLDLPFADDDARAFQRSLLASGWDEDHISLLVNEQATKRNVEIALESWLTKAGKDDLIVLFWSGHGYPDPEDPEKVYFACHDTDINIPATGYRMDRVRQVLEERGARNVVVLADTCHAGKIVTRAGDRGVSVRPFVEKIRREQSVPKGWVFMVSAESDRKAIEHKSWSNGAFTHCLLQAMSGRADGYLSAGAKDGTVTMGELRAYLTTAMPEETLKVLGVAKHPLITTSTGDPEIWNLTLSP